MIKRTKVFYPHIVKQYESVEQFISENNYEEFYAAVRGELVGAGIELSNSAQYIETLSDDGFEAVSTVVFNDQAQYDSYLALVAVHDDKRAPIFEENIEAHLI